MIQTELLPIETAPQRDVRLRKHVNAVALMPTKDGGKISVADRRLFNALLLLAQEQAKQGTVEPGAGYAARLHEVLKITEFNSNNTAEIKRSLKQLMKTVVEWQSPTIGETADWEACVLLSGASIKREGPTTVWLRWRYDFKIAEQLLSPDRYANLLFKASINLRTHAAMALYEICVRYIDNPRHLTSKQHWRWWRPILAGMATKEETGEYRYWKRDVLTPAIADINANTELTITGPIETRERDNKTISLLQFDVRLKQRSEAAPKAAAQGEKLQPEELPLIGKALQVGVPQIDAEKLLRQHGSDVFVQGVAELEKRLSMPTDVVGAVDKPGAWLRAKLKNKSTSPVAPQAEPSRQGRAQDLERDKAALTEEWLRRKKDQLRSLFQELPVAEQEELVGRFRSTLSVAPLLKRLDSSGWDHKLIRDPFAAFLGQTWSGADWSSPQQDDLLALALARKE
jgi:hypothetical protein